MAWGKLLKSPMDGPDQ